MATKEETLTLVEGLARIARDFRLESVKVGDIELVKRHHDFDMPPPKKDGESVSEEDLFYSSEG